MAKTTSERSFLTPAQELAMAIKLASEGHLDQTDRGGVPYILHPLKVMHYLKVTDDYQLMAIAVLHDYLEDCDATVQDLVDLGFSFRVCRCVLRLTKKPDQTPEEYLEDIKGSYDAVRVKLADLRHNTDIRRLKGLREKDFERMAKYHKMFTELKAVKLKFEGVNND